MQRHVRAFLEGCTSPSPRAVSLCAGDGRDLLEVLARDPRGPQVRALLVELNPDLAARAQERAASAQLDAIEVICADAAVTDIYYGAVPAELVLVCGVFGNISDSDVRRTVASLPQLCAPDATVIWTRHRRDADLTPRIREWFVSAGFREHAFDSPGPNAWSVGMHSFHGNPQQLARGRRLFTFVR